MKTLEIIFGHSCYHTMKNSKLNDNILMLNVLFNVGDLSNYRNHKINIPENLLLEDKNVNFESEYNIIVDNIKQKNKIRVWTGRNDIYSYLIMLYICSIVKDYNYELYVLYCDDYNNDYPSPSVMKEEELKVLSRLEHKLTNEEINNNVNIWNNLVSDNSDLRVIDSGNVKSVSMNFYNNFIIDTLKPMGKVKMCQLIGKLMQNVYMHDTMYVYLIDRLISINKIKMTLYNGSRYFESLIEVIE